MDSTKLGQFGSGLLPGMEMFENVAVYSNFEHCIVDRLWIAISIIRLFSMPACMGHTAFAMPTNLSSGICKTLTRSSAAKSKARVLVSEA